MTFSVSFYTPYHFTLKDRLFRGHLTRYPESKFNKYISILTV